MIRTQFDNSDLGEMLFIADAAYHAGFKRVEVDPEHQIAILVELIQLRDERKVRLQ